MPNDVAAPISSLWQPLAPGNRTVLAKPKGLWTLVNDFVEGSHWLKITALADGVWSYADAPDAHCGADGNSQALLYSTKCLSPDAPVGALIAKIGGSSVGARDGTIFVVGRHCVLRVPEDGGPLYLTINDEQAGMGNNAGAIDVEIAIAPCKPAPKPPLSSLVAEVAKALGWPPAPPGAPPAGPTGSNPGGKP